MNKNKQPSTAEGLEELDELIDQISTGKWPDVSSSATDSKESDQHAEEIVKNIKPTRKSIFQKLLNVVKTNAKNIALNMQKNSIKQKVVTEEGIIENAQQKKTSALKSLVNMINEPGANLTEGKTVDSSKSKTKAHTLTSVEDMFTKLDGLTNGAEGHEDTFNISRSKIFNSLIEGLETQGNTNIITTYKQKNKKTTTEKHLTNTVMKAINSDVKDSEAVQKDVKSYVDSLLKVAKHQEKQTGLLAQNAQLIMQKKALKEKSHPPSTLSEMPKVTSVKLSDRER